MSTLLGRTVIYHQPQGEAPFNATTVHPAVVTRVWGEGPRATVNLHVMFDANPAQARTSVVHQGMSVPGAPAWRYPDEDPVFRG